MSWLLDAKVQMLGSEILWREIIGNLLGLISAVLGMQRKVWAWPIGALANVMLFTIFLGGVFATPQAKDLYGQAGRQVFFFIVAIYGWYRWHQTKSHGPVAVHPRWATTGERLTLIAILGLGTIMGAAVLSQLDSYGPWADAWIFIGSFVATLGMARGLVEFWLVWIAVDLVGVPLLLIAGYYPSAILYGVYGIFCAVGFFSWWRVNRAESHSLATA